MIYSFFGFTAALVLCAGILRDALPGDAFLGVCAIIPFAALAIAYWGATRWRPHKASLTVRGEGGVMAALQEEGAVTAAGRARAACGVGLQLRIAPAGPRQNLSHPLPEKGQ